MKAWLQEIDLVRDFEAGYLVGHGSTSAIAHESLGSWFSRLRVTLHHFDFDVGSTFDMVAFGVESAVMCVFVCMFFSQTKLIVWLI